MPEKIEKEKGRREKKRNDRQILILSDRYCSSKRKQVCRHDFFSFVHHCITMQYALRNKNNIFSFISIC
jgi:hypothetical protein